MMLGSEDCLPILLVRTEERNCVVYRTRANYQIQNLFELNGLMRYAILLANLLLLCGERHSHGIQVPLLLLSVSKWFLVPVFHLCSEQVCT